MSCILIHMRNADYRSQFSFRHRLTAVLSRQFSNFTYTSKGGLIRGMKRKGGLGFLAFTAAETAEERFLRSLDFTGKNVYDIGGFQGLLTMFFAKTALRVITYEANPANVVRILENVELNGFDSVLIRNIAIGDSDGILTLWFDPLMTGAASGDPEISEEIATTSKHAKKFLTAITSLDADIKRFQLPVPDFIKIDIEGMELEALKGMTTALTEAKPEIYIEMHGTSAEDKRKNAETVFGFLRMHEYQMFDVERGRVVDGEATGQQSHVYCVHSQRAAQCLAKISFAPEDNVLVAETIPLRS